MTPDPNILRFIDFYAHPTQYIIVTDAMHLNLLEYLDWRHNELTEAEVREIFRSAVRAVAATHRKGIIHRDIKPENILLRVDQDGEQVHEIKLCDFGFACLFGMHNDTGRYGTCGYMAPEIIINGHSYDKSVDAYSLGVVLYNLITG